MSQQVKPLTAQQRWYRKNKRKKAAYDVVYRATHKEKSAAYDAARKEEKAAYNAARRITFLAQGKCPIHPSSDVAPGCKCCRECLDYRNNIHWPLRRARKRAVAYEPVNRLVVFKRDKWKCQHCGKRVNRKTAHADHIIPLSRGGSHTYSNHQTLCGPCNLSKGNRIPQR